MPAPSQCRTGWLSISAMNAVSKVLDAPYIRVYEVATFYTMFNRSAARTAAYSSPPRYQGPHWQVPRPGVHNDAVHGLRRVRRVQGRQGQSRSAALRRQRPSHGCAAGIGNGETTSDGLFTVTEVECLGACVNAPMIQINDEFYVRPAHPLRQLTRLQEDLKVSDVHEILDALKRGETPKPGPRWGRACTLRLHSCLAATAAPPPSPLRGSHRSRARPRLPASASAPMASCSLRALYALGFAQCMRQPRGRRAT